MQTLKFRNYVKKAIPYQVKIERLGAPKPAPGAKETKAPPSEFTLLEKDVVTAPAADSKEGVEVPITLKFEPSSMNESKALLTISNAEGGTYQYYLIGQATSPQPKGPYKSLGKGIAIDFKNPFFEATEFTVRIDNPSFTTSVKNPWRLEVGLSDAARQTHDDPRGLQGGARPRRQRPRDGLDARRAAVDLLRPGRLVINTAGTPLLINRPVIRIFDLNYNSRRGDQRRRPPLLYPLL